MATTPVSAADLAAEHAAELAAEAAQAADRAFIAEIEAANVAFRDAHQPRVVEDLVLGMAGDPRQHRGGHAPMTPAFMAALIPADKRDAFMAALNAAVAGLNAHRGRPPLGARG